MNSSKAQMIAAMRGPLMLITLGVLFLLDYSGGYPFYKTFPVLLIVFGVLKLLERLAAQWDSPGQTPAGKEAL